MDTKRLFLLCGILFLSACDKSASIITSCENTAGIEAICRFTNPEDMELLPDQQTLLISQMGNMEGTKAGNLVAFNTQTQNITALFPLPNTDTTTENWGTKNCPGKPGAEFSPHGISLKQRNDGRWQLAVVNHGQRESVEMFEVSNNNGLFTLAWRGCIVPTDGIYMNDVALLKDGGFVASHMFDKHAPTLFGLSTGMWKSQMGINTGYVFEWQPAKADVFRVLEGSRGPFINGVLASADDQNIFANVYPGNEIRKLDRSSGNALASAAVMQADNIAWDARGFLLAASHSGNKLDQMSCLKHPGETCGFGFTIVRINPDTMAKEIIFQHEGAPMGAATVAMQVGAQLYMGSFSGNRIIKTAYPQ